MRSRRKGSIKCEGFKHSTRAIVCNLLLASQVALFVSTLLHNKRTLPGFLYSELSLAFHRRHPQVALNEGGADALSPILDAQGLTHELLICSFQYHPLLAQSDESVIETVNAIDRTVSWNLYPKVFSFFKNECSEADELLRRNCAGVKIANDEATTRALLATATARSGIDKMHCLTRFVEMVSADCGGNGASADDLVPALVYAIARACPQMHLHAELAFIEKFCRNEIMFFGKDGYALTSVKGAVTAATRGDDESS